MYTLIIKWSACVLTTESMRTQSDLLVLDFIFLEIQSWEELVRHAVVMLVSRISTDAVV